MKNKKLISKLMKERNTAKEFDTNAPRISDKELFEITEAIRMTPISLGLLSGRIIVMRNGEFKKSLSELVMNQKNFITSDIHIFFISPDVERAKNIGVNKTLEPVKKQYPDKVEAYEKLLVSGIKWWTSGEKGTPGDEWLIRQAYIQTGVATLAAANLGIDTVIQEGYDPKGIKNLFVEKGIMQPDENVAIIMGFGYGGKSSGRAKNRLSSEEFTTIIK